MAIQLTLEFDNPQQVHEALDLLFGTMAKPPTQTGYPSTQSGNEPPPTPARDIAREAAKALPEMAPAAQKVIEDYSDIPVKQAMQEIGKGTGKGGRILKKDVEQYLREKEAEAKAPAASGGKPAQNGSEALSEEDAKAALKAMYARIAEEADRDTARAECKAVLDYFGVENAAGVKSAERRLFVDHCAKGHAPKEKAPEAGETPTEPEKPAESASETPSEAPKEAEDYAITDCRAAIKELNDEKGMNVCLKLLKEEFGVASIKELKQEQYARFCEQAYKLAAREEG